jgi:hypothetical protein
VNAVIAFSCPVCRALVHFEDSVCVASDTPLAYDPDRRAMVQADARCANAALIGCNWHPARDGDLCAACLTTRVRPADDDLDGLRGWARAEAAKRRLLFELAELSLPWDGLRFELLSSARGPVTTGHVDGVITLDLAESDDAHRLEMRDRLGEAYRTVLGHFRHEVGHYYQGVLVPEGSPDAERMRSLFGDERADYAAAMERHYAQGAPADWADTHVSAYATMHPWEDWAETFAQYLHIEDAMQTARSYGVTLAVPPAGFAALLSDWVPLSIALNAMNRSLGLDDLYPFVLSAPVIEKLGFIDGLITRRRTASAATPR